MHVQNALDFYLETIRFVLLADFNKFCIGNNFFMELAEFAEDCYSLCSVDYMMPPVSSCLSGSPNMDFGNKPENVLRVESRRASYSSSRWTKTADKAS